MATNRSTWDDLLGVRVVEPAAEPKWMRADALENAYLGFGTSRDKLASGSFGFVCKLTDFELNAMYYTDDVSAKIVNKRPAEMMRRGYHLRSKKNPEAAKALEKKGAALGLNERILRAMQWGRLWGGCVVVIGANDSPYLTKPLDPKRVREVKYLNVVDRRWVNVHKFQDDPNLPNFGEPEIYVVGGLSGKVYFVHASRVVRFDGVPETDPITRRGMMGWTYSVLQRPYEIVRDFAGTFKATAHLLVDASQGVWKIQNLLEMLASDKDTLMTRLAFADMSRSAARAIMLDAENENFERVATSFAGVDAMIDRWQQRMASAADMPVTILMGRSPAGMNATGDSDFRAWYDEIATDQKNELSPKLLYLYQAIGGPETPDDLEIEHCALWQPTDQEKAQTYLATAQGDQIYMTNTAVLPEQVAIARFGSGEGKIEIDEAALKKAIKTEIDLMLNPPPEPQTPPADPNADPNAKPVVKNGAPAKPTGQ